MPCLHPDSAPPGTIAGRQTYKQEPGANGGSFITLSVGSVLVLVGLLVAPLAH